MNRYIILISALCLLLGALSVDANAQLVFVDPPLTVQCVDTMFWVDILVDSLVDSIHSYMCVMYIDTSAVYPESVTRGTMFDEFPNVWFEWNYDDFFPDSLYFGASIFGAGTFVSGPGQLARIMLTGKRVGETPVAFGQCILRDPIPFSDPIEVTTEDGQIIVLGPGYPIGDVNNDDVIDLGDVVYLINYLYRSGPEPLPLWIVGDVNCDLVVDLGDVVYLINYLYRGGPEPCNPCE